MTKQQQFFYDHAGSSHDPLTETAEQGRVRGAMQLAAAEGYANEECWRYEWESDAENADEQACFLYSFEGKPLASLCGITGATDDYRRVVEAELALQAMGWPAPAPRSPQEAAVKAAPASGKVLTDEQLRRLHDVLDDIINLTDCNCCDGGCDGTCTCSMAEALLRDLAPWPARYPQKPQEPEPEAVGVGTRVRLRYDGRDEDIVIPAGTVGVVLDVYATGGCYIDFAELGAAWNDIEPHEMPRLFEVLPQEAATGPQEPQEAAAQAAPPDVVCSHCGGRYIEPLEGALWECYDCGELLRVAAAAPVPRYTVNLHVISLYGGERVREVYQGGDETVMYSHVSAIEWTLAMTGGTAEIEIVEDGRERWIDYQDGKRDGLPQEAE